MSHSKYTASERRGILVIAIISLALVGAGWGVSFCHRQQPADVYPIVTDYPEMVDSSAVLQEKDIKNLKEKQKKEKKTKKQSNPSKTYPNRSPLDEPV